MKTISEVIDFVIEKSRQIGQNDEKLSVLINKTPNLACYKENATIRDLELEQWGLSRELNTIKWIYEDKTNGEA